MTDASSETQSAPSGSDGPKDRQIQQAHHFPEGAKVLRDGPIKNLLRTYIFIGIPSILFADYAFSTTSSHQDLSIIPVIAVLACILIGIYLLWSTAYRIVDAIQGYQHLRSARLAVRSGQITPTFGYADKGRIRPILVDEKNRKIWIDREIISFDDVREIKADIQSSLHWNKNSKMAREWGRLDVITGRGDNPILTALLETSEDRDRAFYRLSNALAL